MNECACEQCKKACTVKPGWFLPTEAAEVARYMGENTEQFFLKYLGIDRWYIDHHKSISVLSPAVKTMLPGVNYLNPSLGECVFYSEGDCLIHEVKPHECKQYMHTDTDLEIHCRHEFIALMWEYYQNEIESLLDRTPKSNLEIF
jgi:Fe-S-cluster containining protein